MRRTFNSLALSALGALLSGALALSAAEAQNTDPSVGPPAPPPTQTTAPLNDPMENFDKRLSIVEEWKTKVEKLPSLSNKVNFGLNALQFLYTHQDAKVAEGKSQDNFSIRRSELLAYGKINECIPRWHVLYEFQSIGLTNRRPAVMPGRTAPIVRPIRSAVLLPRRFFANRISIFGPSYQRRLS